MHCSYMVLNSNGPVLDQICSVMPACPGFPAYLAPEAVERDSEGHIAIIEEAVVDVHTAVATPNDLARAIDPGLEHTSAYTSALQYVWRGK